MRDLLSFTGTTLLDHVDYGGFGNVITETQTSNGDRYKYTGREFDSLTGLQYNRARYYDSVTGRWISQDPIGFDGGDGNLYRYVRNSPTIATDPSGMDSSFDDWKKTWTVDGHWTFTVPTKEQATQWHNKWKKLEVEVYESDYFKTPLWEILRDVGAFYNIFGVSIRWRVSRIPTPDGAPTVRICEAAGAGSPRAILVATTPQHPYSYKLRTPRYNGDNLEHPRAGFQWFWTNFPHKPSVFFIGDISKEWEKPFLFGPDAQGVSFPKDRPSFAFVPLHRDVDQSYVFTIAHEIGHFIFGPGHTATGLMIERGVVNLD